MHMKYKDEQININFRGYYKSAHTQNPIMQYMSFVGTNIKPLYNFVLVYTETWWGVNFL